ncbi:MAG TPA: cobyrinate a,c-diamide synthase [Thermodesulfobacteriaceae bacterium]|nr:cobyrinate a,c-diamide synthase [Thermodesulfobacteriaceae bacterium]
MGADKAVIIAGSRSGSGKTTVALGLMAALTGLGLKVQPFKCGPDFIDPTLHRLVTGRVSRNLDIWMCGENFARQTFARHSRNADISIIEGVMGMFDGGDSSSAALAAGLGVPVVLVLDVRSTAESAAAVLKGFETLEPQMAPRGVILNMVAGPRHLELVSEAVRKHCRAEILGHLPRSLNFAIPERHLGLHMGHEASVSPRAIAELAGSFRKHLDLDKLMDIASESESRDMISRQPSAGPSARIAVARDKAFCFYYEDNLDLLRSAGAELVFFSPLEDECLPEDITAIYLGGGYPELYLETLSGNGKMLAAVRRWAENGGRIYAECGGFMYLTMGILDGDERFHSMVGIFPVLARMRKKRVALGYREVCLKDDCLIGSAGTMLRGHEYHYSRIDEMPPEVPRLYAVNNGTEEGYGYKNVLGSYMHLHFGFNPRAVKKFVLNLGKRALEGK